MATAPWPALRAAPWASASPRDIQCVLVTGANSGVGLGICERLIDTFLTDHPLTAHLIILPTTRSASKAAETVTHLRAYLLRAASTNKSLRARGVRDLTTGALDRVHIAAVQLDLCDFATVYHAAKQLVEGTVYFDDLDQALKIPHLNAVIFNAGFGGWTGISWIGFAYDILVAGWVHATTRPTFKRSTPGRTINPLPKLATKEVPELGEVFCANVFGHYLFAWYLMALLERPGKNEDKEPAPGRIIWQSSVDPHLGHFDVDDMQGIKSKGAYESSKMLTDILALTSEIGPCRFWSQSFFASDPDAVLNKSAKTIVRPRAYVAHPGIVTTTLMPLHFTLMWFYMLGITLSRWLGSAWHPVSPYKAAISSVWLALASKEELQEANAQRIKWGSATDFWGKEYVKKTEVDGWGWDGEVESREDIEEEDKALPRVMRKMVGRWRHAELVTKEKREKFDDMATKCWDQMEELREEWVERLPKLLEE